MAVACPEPFDPGQGGTTIMAASAQEESLGLFATLLGTFLLREEDGDDHREKSQPRRNEGLLELLMDIENHPEDDFHSSRSSFTCLSLEHGGGGGGGRGDHAPPLSPPHQQHHHRHKRCHSAAGTASSGKTKEEAEAEAALLLGRSLWASPSGSRTLTSKRPSGASGDDDCVHMTLIPHLLLRNLYESFSVLVDARLRAYASFLAHHVQSLAHCQALTPAERDEAVAGIERKLEILMLLGSNISVDAVVTSFQVTTTTTTTTATTTDDNNNNNNSTTTEGDEDEGNFGYCVTSDGANAGTVVLPIALEGVLDLTIPHRHFGVRNTTVTICASGTITGEFQGTTSRLRSVHVALDTQELLAAMIEQASQIVSVIVEMTNDACSGRERSCRSPSSKSLAHLALPGVDEMNRTVMDEHSNRKVTCVVTPDLTGHSVGPRNVPSLSLDDVKGDDTNNSNAGSNSNNSSNSSSVNDENLSSLSVERCATIVDFAICDIDDKILCPLAKKPRVAPATLSSE